MLADQLAAVLYQLLSAFLFGGLIVPGTGEGYFHGSGGAYGACAEEEGGVAGNNFSIGESAYIADLGFFGLELTGLDHGVQLHTGSDTGEETALIDGGESVVIVGKTLGVSLGAGGVAELYLGELLGGLDHVILMTEAVGEDDVAAGVGELSSGVVALLTLGNVGLDNIVFFGNAQGSAGFLSGIDEVEVIGGVFIVKHDETDLDSGGLGALSGSLGTFGGSGSLGALGGSGLFSSGGSAGCYAQSQHESQNDSYEFLHLG